MNFEERCILQMEMRLKGLKFQDLAEKIGKSKSWISQFFHNKANLSQSDLDIIVNFIKEYQSNK